MALVIPLKLFRDLTSGTEYFNNDPKPWEEPNNAWRGIDYNLTTTPVNITPIWIGVSSDGESTQVYQISTKVKTIRQVWPRVYQGTQIELAGGSILAFSDQFENVTKALQKCCFTSIRSGAFVYKISDKSLTPGVDYQCETEAGFKWLAVLGSDNPAANYFFEIELLSQDGMTNLVGVLSSGPLPETTQLVINWPEDFIGLTIDGVTLVANDQVAGPGELNVEAFDFGTITVRTRVVIFPADEKIQEKSFSLPTTNCIEDDDDSTSSGAGYFADFFAGDFGSEFFI